MQGVLGSMTDNEIYLQRIITYSVQSVVASLENKLNKNLDKFSRLYCINNSIRRTLGKDFSNHSDVEFGVSKWELSSQQGKSRRNSRCLAAMQLLFKPSYCVHTIYQLTLLQHISG